MQAIRQLCENDTSDEDMSPASQLPVDVTHVRTLLQGLIPFLEEGNADAVLQLKKLQESLFDTQFVQLFRELEAQIHHYDFEEALVTLEKFEKMLQDFENGGSQ